MGPSETVRTKAAAALEVLRSGDADIAAIAKAVGASRETLHRSLRWLRQIGAPIEFVPNVAKGNSGRPGVWRLLDCTWAVPLFKLTARGYVPVSTAETERCDHG